MLTHSGDLGRLDELGGGLEVLAVATGLADLDSIPDLDPVAGDVGRPAVHREVAMADELASLGTAGGEAHAEDDVVEPHLEQAQEVLAGHPLALLAFSK